MYSLWCYSACQKKKKKYCIHYFVDSPIWAWIILLILFSEMVKIFSTQELLRHISLLPRDELEVIIPTGIQCQQEYSTFQFFPHVGNVSLSKRRKEPYHFSTRQEFKNGCIVFAVETLALVKAFLSFFFSFWDSTPPPSLNAALLVIHISWAFFHSQSFTKSYVKALTLLVG